MSTSSYCTHPTWVPKSARVYLQHVVDGVPIRAIAREMDCHASTVLRMVRRCEQLRDDPLIDHALKRLGRQRTGAKSPGFTSGANTMSKSNLDTVPDQNVISSEARRVLRRMSEPGACLAVAQGMEKAVVVRETGDGQTVRTAVIDTAIAEALALKGWIEAKVTGKVARYFIKPAGRVALRDLLLELNTPEAAPETDTRGMRYGVQETPLMMLARRRDKDGQVFLTPDLVHAGERLREDFELAQLTSDSESALAELMGQPTAPTLAQADVVGSGRDAARARLGAVMQELGPGLGDVVLRACCHLEGMETIEKRMGWAARSGKIVLRIGLQRLQRHYAETHGNLSPLIG